MVNDMNLLSSNSSHLECIWKAKSSNREALPSLSKVITPLAILIIRSVLRIALLTRLWRYLFANLCMLGWRLQKSDEYVHGSFGWRMICLILVEPIGAFDEPVYFRHKDDLEYTGIPALQALCRKLADSTEKQEAISNLRCMRALMASIDLHLTAYVKESAELAAFRRMWKEGTIP